MKTENNYLEEQQTSGNKAFFTRDAFFFRRWNSEIGGQMT